MRTAPTPGDRASPKTAGSLSALSADVSEEFPDIASLQGKRKSAATTTDAGNYLRQSRHHLQNDGGWPSSVTVVTSQYELTCYLPETESRASCFAAG